MTTLKESKHVAIIASLNVVFLKENCIFFDNDQFCMKKIIMRNANLMQ